MSKYNDDMEFQKLVRDKMPEVIRMYSPNAKAITRTLTKVQYSAALKNKLCEETKEVCEAKTRGELGDELADVLEVLHAMAKNAGIDWESIEDGCELKREERGGYDTRLFLERTVHDPSPEPEVEPKPEPQVEDEPWKLPDILPQYDTIHELCFECGMHFGRPPGRAIGIWGGKCDICGREMRVTASRDFGFLKRYPKKFGGPGFETCDECHGKGHRDCNCSYRHDTDQYSHEDECAVYEKCGTCQGRGYKISS